jgi:hypothetical protein
LFAVAVNVYVVPLASPVTSELVTGAATEKVFTTVVPT